MRPLGELLPWLAARYWQARIRAVESKRLYDLASARHGGRYPQLLGRGYSGDSVNAQAGTKLRDWARYLDENSDVGIAVLDTLVDQIAPIEPEPMVTRNGRPAREINDRLAELWPLWTERADVAEAHPWDQLKRLAARSWLRDGEAFVLPIEGAARGVRFGALPLALQILEAEFCPLTMTDEAKGIVQGVQLNRWGRASSYFLLRRHPGGVLPFVNTEQLEDGRFVAGDNVLHLKFTRRLAQVRGVSIFAGVSTRMLDLKHYEESERIAARVAASFTAVVTRPAAIGQTPKYTADGSARAFEMQAGMVMDELGPGEGIEVVNPARPNPNLAPFRAAMIRGVAGGTGASYSTVARDYSGTYSSQRQELVEQQQRYRGPRDYWIAAFLEPIYRRFVRMAVATGQLNAPGFTLEELSKAIYSGFVVPWIDPAKEVDADVQAVEAGFTSRQDVLRRRGADRRLIDAERDADDAPGAPRAPALSLVDNGEDPDEETA